MKSGDWKKRYKKAFPYATMRELQAEALDAIAGAFSDGKKHVVLELPTGVGKSGIGVAIAAAHENAWYVTVQKLLQDQYTSEFGDTMYVLKGRNAYDCAYYAGKSCDAGGCKYQPSLKKKHGMECPYTRAVAEALNASITLFNVHSLHYQSQYGAFRGQTREVLIVDEAHKLETTYMSIYCVPLRESSIGKPIPYYSNAVGYYGFLSEVQAEAGKRIEDLLSSRSLTERQRELLQTLQELSGKITNALDTIREKEWVVQRVDGGVDLKPLYVGAEIRRDLLSLAEYTIHMSATIIDIGQYCESVGLKVDEVEFIRAPSPFDVRNRPIVHYDVGSLSQKNWDENGKYMLEAIRYLLKKHKGQRGIIHTHSDKIARYIEENIDDARLTFKGGNVYTMLDEHRDRPDSVIVASGLSEGLDLKDDLARFAIICKVPYPSLGDVQIKRRMELSRGYYHYLTILKIVQEYGRTVRHENDRSVTYILDGDFTRLPESMLPEWFREAITDEETADKYVNRK